VILGNTEAVLSSWSGLKFAAFTENKLSKIAIPESYTVVFKDSASTTLSNRYLPGPHAGSDSGKKKDAARQALGDTSRLLLESMMKELPPVLSKIGWYGKPV
jgi:hypothetical protein